MLIKGSNKANENYQFRVVLFGVTNGVTNFQQAMNNFITKTEGHLDLFGQWLAGSKNPIKPDTERLSSLYLIMLLHYSCWITNYSFKLCPFAQSKEVHPPQ